MAPWVFASPAIAFALLPSVVGAQHATDGLALVAVITALTAFAGVLIQPLGRRLDASPRGNRAATVGLVAVAAGLGLGAYTAHAQEVWLLVPCAIVLGCAYGLCLVGGLVEVQRMAGPDGLARLTAALLRPHLPRLRGPVPARPRAPTSRATRRCSPPPLRSRSPRRRSSAARSDASPENTADA